MQYIRVILGFPVALVYGLVTFIRNFLFDKGVFAQAKAKIPTFCVGNLTVGGTGKTPHIEYLIRLLQHDYSLATLSRGYKRKTKGFVLASAKSTAQEIGDEPCQYAHKSPQIQVAVDEKRVEGAEKLSALKNPPQLILLDDAFQHRHILPDFSILLTDYEKPFYHDFLLPSGRLRESRQGAKRADILIVSKTPRQISAEEKQKMISKIRPKPHQHVFFSHITYDEPAAFTQKAKELGDFKGKNALVFSGIAKPKPFIDFISQKAEVTSILFPDHHSFTEKDIQNIRESYKKLPAEPKAIFTTEKDAMRLFGFLPQLNDLPVFYVPIKVVFSDEETQLFNALIRKQAKFLSERKRLLS